LFRLHLKIYFNKEEKGLNKILSGCIATWKIGKTWKSQGIWYNREKSGNFTHVLQPTMKILINPRKLKTVAKIYLFYIL